MSNKGNKQWVWLALDVHTREIVGVYIGARDEAAARELWKSLPPLDRQCAIADTDLRQRMAQCYRLNDIELAARKQAEPATKRFNHTLRQRVSRLVRKTLSFSKSLKNHIGAIWYFIHDYNASLLL